MWHIYQSPAHLFNKYFYSNLREGGGGIMFLELAMPVTVVQPWLQGAEAMERREAGEGVGGDIFPPRNSGMKTGLSCTINTIIRE